MAAELSAFFFLSLLDLGVELPAEVLELVRDRATGDIGGLPPMLSASLDRDLARSANLRSVIGLFGIVAVVPPCG